MMTGRERVIRALRFEQPDRAPRDLWHLPGVSMFRPADLEAVLARFPTDITHAPISYGPSHRAQGTPNVVGTYVDEWGCGWSVAESGVIGEVTHPPLADWSALDRYVPPYEILDGADLSTVNAFCAGSSRFVLSFLGTVFERMQYLRGSEALYLDLGLGSDHLLRLRDRVHAFNLQHLELLCATDIDGIHFNDDWGAQDRLLVSPAMWRELFKPLYAEYCQLIHDAGKFVFMHSDGHISTIIPDLIEIGVDALNAQLFCMDIEALARDHRGQITFWGEIDRQQVLPFGTPGDVAAAVRRVRVALEDGSGGVIAQCEFGLDTPRANIEAVFDAWLA